MFSYNIYILYMYVNSIYYILFTYSCPSRRSSEMITAPLTFPWNIHKSTPPAFVQNCVQDWDGVCLDKLPQCLVTCSIWFSKWIGNRVMLEVCVSHEKLSHTSYISKHFCCKLSYLYLAKNALCRIIPLSKCLMINNHGDRVVGPVPKGHFVGL